MADLKWGGNSRYCGTIVGVTIEIIWRNIIKYGEINSKGISSRFDNKDSQNGSLSQAFEELLEAKLK